MSASETDILKAWEDPDHPGNRIRPDVTCIGCGEKGCITAWGPWCFQCNKARMYRINGSFNEIAKGYGLPDPKLKARPSS